MNAGSGVTMNAQPAHEGLRIGISAWAADRSGVERVAEAALSAGIDTFWLGDGLLERPDFPPWSGGMESFGELAWLAGRYPGASVALGAAVLPLRDPQWVAKSAATLDQLDRGAVHAGARPGQLARRVRRHGPRLRQPGCHPRDRLLVAQRIWSAGVRRRGPSPRPWSPGGPPVWLAGARATMLRAIRLGVPFPGIPASAGRTSLRLPGNGSTRAAPSWRCGSGWESAARGPGAGSSRRAPPARAP